MASSGTTTPAPANRGDSAEALARYRARRDFAATPEPAGNAPEATGRTLAFAIQEHHARRLHYDFRLEIGGTLKSWAVPKGPSLDPTQRRMAVQVEDHPLEYGGFEGTIPAGQYGAGRVILWDRGYWVPNGDAARGWAAGKLEFDLFGAKLRGRWHLVRTGRAESERQPGWLLIKGHDAHARPHDAYDVLHALPGSVLAQATRAAGRKPGAASARAARPGPHPALDAQPLREPSEAPATAATAPRTPLPETLQPALATLVDARPPGAGWAWEVKFDGYRILARIEAGRAVLFTRNGHDWTGKLAPLARALEALGLDDGWIDGEIVVPGTDGTPDFQALQRIFEPRRAGRTARESPPPPAASDSLRYYAFDLPFYAGRDLRDEPLQERRGLLQSLMQRAPSGGKVAFSEDFPAGDDLLDTACRMHLEGLIGKRVDSPYPRGRTRDWVKLKCAQRQEFVIGGWTDPQGSREALGALLVGVHDAHGALRYAGKVGTGFDGAGLRALAAALAPHASAECPFDANPRERGAHWVEPVLVAEVSFAEWTGDGRLRHAVFKGLREDKPARVIVREQALPAGSIAAQVSGAASSRSPAPPAKPAPPSRAASASRLTNPERVVDAQSGITKAGLHAWYEAAAPFMLPHLADRPVALLRAPEGVGGTTFFQKHAADRQMPLLTRLDPALDTDHEALLGIPSAAALLQAVQMNVIEFHTWNARVDRIEQPDRMVFDLDPGEGVEWAQVVEGTMLVRGLLEELGLSSLLKTSGGKGLHVVVPLARREGWDVVKGFSQAVVQHLAEHVGQRFVAKSGPKNRIGRIFVDYLRNGRGATTVAAYSVRVRPGLGVSLPIGWDELPTLPNPHATVANAVPLLEASAAAWSGWERLRQPLGPAMKRLGWKPPAG